MQSLPQMYSFVAILPEWLAWLVVALAVTWTMVAYGFLIARTGRGPLWALGVLLPFVGVVVLWWLAYGRWPRDGRR